MPSRAGLVASLRRHGARVAATAAVAGLCAAALAGGAPAAAEGPARAAASTGRLLVRAHEWRFELSRLRLRRGRLVVQLRNLGEDAHDLVARRLDRRGRPTGARQRVGETTPGVTTQARLRLRRGRYRLVCSLPGHAALGMRATITVR